MSCKRTQPGAAVLPDFFKLRSVKRITFRFPRTRPHRCIPISDVLPRRYVIWSIFTTMLRIENMFFDGSPLACKWRTLRPTFHGREWELN